MNRESVVVPGEELCVIEEFLPGRWTKKSSDGNIYSIVLGKPVFDVKNHVVTVNPLKNVETFSIGEYVIAEVKSLQDRIAVVNIIGKLGKGMLKYPKMAVIVLRNNKNQLDNIIGIGDIVVGRVVNVKNGMITLDIQPHNCGALLSRCSYCGSILLRRKNELVCSRCRRSEKRKIHLDYGNVNKLLNYVRL